MFKNVTEEIKWLQKRIESNPQSVLFARLAERFLQMEEYDRAIETCTQGLEEHPDYANAHLVLAKSYMKKNDFELADQEFRKLLAIQSNHLTAHKLYGDLMTHTGWANSAETSYEKILEIDPLETHMKEPLTNFSFDVQRSAAPGANIEPVGERDTDFEEETMQDLFGMEEAEAETKTDGDSLFGGTTSWEKTPEISTPEPKVARELSDLDEEDFRLENDTVDALFNQSDDEDDDMSFIGEQSDESDEMFKVDTDEEGASEIDDWTAGVDEMQDEADEIFGGAVATTADDQPSPVQPQHSQPKVDDIFGSEEVNDIFNTYGPEDEEEVETAPEPQVKEEFIPEPQPEPQVKEEFIPELEPEADDDVFASSPDDEEDWGQSLEDEEEFGMEGPRVATDSARDDKDKYSDILEGIFSQDIDEEEQREAETRDKLEQVISEAEETTELDESYNFDDMDAREPQVDLSWGNKDDDQDFSPEDMILNHADTAEMIPDQDTLSDEDTADSIPQGYVAFEESDEEEQLETGSVHMQDLDQGPEDLDEDEEEFSDFLAGLGDPKEFNDVSDDEPEADTDTDTDDFEFPDMEEPDQKFISEPEKHDSQAAMPAFTDDDGEEKPKEKFVTPTLGEIYAAQGQYAKAIHVFEMLLEKSPDNEFYLSKLEYLRKKLSDSE